MKITKSLTKTLLCKVYRQKSVLHLERFMKDKVVIITGASSGIGKALAFSFGREGAKIVITGRKEIPLMEVSYELTNERIENFAFISDVSIEADNAEMIKKTIQKYGKVDVLINNAGISMRALFSEVKLEVLKSVMDVNFWGTVYCTRYAIDHLIKSKGSLVGISSIAGIQGLPGRTGYSASKFAMQGFLESVRIENLKNGLDVLIACPGFTASNIRNVALSKDGSSQGESPLNESKIANTDTVANEIVKGIIQQKRVLVLSFQGKITIWLRKFFPAFLDKQVFNHFAAEPDSPLK